MEEKTLKLYRLNEAEWWAAYSLEEAIAVAMTETGLPADEVTDDYLGEADPDKVMVWSQDWPDSQTDGIPASTIMAKMKEPGLVCSTVW